MWGRKDCVYDRVEYTFNPDDALTSLLVDIKSEVGRARAKFPGDNATFAALVEEVGELAKALMEEPTANVRAEAIQVATMAIRIILDGDTTMNDWREEKLLDHLTEPTEDR